MGRSARGCRWSILPTNTCTLWYKNRGTPYHGQRSAARRRNNTWRKVSPHLSREPSTGMVFLGAWFLSEVSRFIQKRRMVETFNTTTPHEPHHSLLARPYAFIVDEKKKKGKPCVGCTPPHLHNFLRGK